MQPGLKQVHSNALFVKLVNMQSSIKCYNCDFKQLVPIGKDVVAFHELSYCVDQPDRSIRATKSRPPQKCHLYNAPSSVSKPSFGVGNQPDKLRSGETSFRYLGFSGFHGNIQQKAYKL